jgi:hypothetical protein
MIDCNKPKRNRIGEDLQKKRDHYHANKTLYNQRHKEWIEKNKEKYNAYMRKWNKENQNYSTASVRQNRANYRARLLNATPKWVEQDKINAIYQLAKRLELELKMKLHVDHIEALNGNNFSGLHTWWNLQILPGTVNQSKSNKIKNIILPRVSDNFDEYLREVENLCRTYTNN